MGLKSKRKPLSYQEKQQVLALWKLNYSHQYIANKMGAGRSTITKLILKNKGLLVESDTNKELSNDGRDKDSYKVALKKKISKQYEIIDQPFMNSISTKQTLINNSCTCSNPLLSLEKFTNIHCNTIIVKSNVPSYFNYNAPIISPYNQSSICSLIESDDTQYTLNNLNTIEGKFAPSEQPYLLTSNISNEIQTNINLLNIKQQMVDNYSPISYSPTNYGQLFNQYINCI